MTSIFHFIHKYLEIIFFTILVIIGVFAVDDYGITWDEDTQRETGIYNYDYAIKGDTKLLSWRDQDYGPVFEMSLVAIERIFNQIDSREIYLTRHLITHLFYLLGVFFCFKLVYKLYDNKWIALLVSCCVILHPRLYAHSFFNTKDIPFLSLLMICLYQTYIAFNNKNNQSFLVLGVLIGVLINVRIMGVLLPSVLILFIILNAIKTQDYVKHVKLGCLMIGFSFLTLYATWPFLWTAPIENFMIAFENMSSFRFSAPVLFAGQAIPASELPWSYIPIWFSVTTPLVFILFGFSGLVWFTKDFFSEIKTSLFGDSSRFYLLVTGLFIGPYLAILLFSSVLYDGWRQMYFIYVPFVLFIAYVLHKVWSRKWVKIGMIGALSLTCLMSVFFMIKNRGVQQVYFNELVSTAESNSIRKSYDLDYWGTSYRKSFEYILANDTSDSIHVLVENTPGIYNLDILTKEQQNRLIVTRVDSIIDADYFVTEYRFHPQDYHELKDKSLFQVRCLNSTVSEVFKLK